MFPPIVSPFANTDLLISSIALKCAIKNSTDRFADFLAIDHKLMNDFNGTMASIATDNECVDQEGDLILWESR